MLLISNIALKTADSNIPNKNITIYVPLCSFKGTQPHLSRLDTDIIYAQIFQSVRFIENISY